MEFWTNLFSAVLLAGCAIQLYLIFAKFGSPLMSHRGFVMVETGFALLIGHYLFEMAGCNGTTRTPLMIFLQMGMENGALILVFLGIRYKLILFNELMKKAPPKVGEMTNLFEERVASVIGRRPNIK